MELNGAKILYTIHTNIPVLGDFKITQTLVSTWIVMALLSALAFWLGRDLKLENVSKRQAAAEFIVERLDQFVKGWYKALEDLVWLTQLGLNMLLPLVMCLGGCWWAVSHWGWPMWVYLPAVLLGLAAGAQNFWVFVKERLDRSKKDKPRRTGFNSHL